MIPRSVRNNNPGNIRPGANFIGEVGKDDGFAIFCDTAHGVRAIWRVLHTYRLKHELTTIEQVIKRWSATDQESYINTVESFVHKTRDQQLEWPIDYRPLIHAITHVESGGWPIDEMFIEAVYAHESDFHPHA